VLDVRQRAVVAEHQHGVAVDRLDDVVRRERPAQVDAGQLGGEDGCEGPRGLGDGRHRDSSGFRPRS